MKPGNRVRFLNEKGEGVVTRLKDKHTAFVEVNGFEIPYRIEELVLIDTEIVWDAAASKQAISKTEAVYFVVEPDHELPLLQAKHQFHLLNASSYHLFFLYFIKIKNKNQLIKKGELEPFKTIALQQISKEQLKQNAIHAVEMLFFKKQECIAQIPCVQSVQISDLVLKHQLFEPHDLFRFPVWLHPLKNDFVDTKKVKETLTDEDVMRLKKVKEFKPQEKKSIPHHNPVFFVEKEVDLHAENVLDSFKNMSNHEILQVQLKHFQQKLDEAIAKRYYKITFIHGVGNGRLKEEIICVLKKYAEDIRFQDGDYGKYGFGATEVFIKQ
ncbi:MAG: DUF2027 domain-containing protein [Bacteroidetes bacterium]|nr:DUF2027 domain-containing protein [Bacteroidota bacterium]